MAEAAEVSSSHRKLGIFSGFWGSDEIADTGWEGGEKEENFAAAQTWPFQEPADNGK